MSPLRWRARRSLLLLGGCLLAAAGRKQGAAGIAAESASGSAGGSSGRFVSPERHTCSWQLLPARPRARSRQRAGAALPKGPDGALHQCAYRGEPRRCAVYAARRSHYWEAGAEPAAQEAAALPTPRRSRPACAPARRAVARSCAGAPVGRHPQSSGGLNQDPEAPGRGPGAAPEPALGPVAGAPASPERAAQKGSPLSRSPKGARGSGLGPRRGATTGDRA